MKTGMELLNKIGRSRFSRAFLGNMLCIVMFIFVFSLFNHMHNNILYCVQDIQSCVLPMR